MSKSSLGVNILRTHEQYIHLSIRELVGSMNFLCTAVYGSPQKTYRDGLWEELRGLAGVTQEPWLIVGDFNAILNADDRKGGKEQRAMACRKFSSFVFNHNIVAWGLKDRNLLGTEGTFTNALTELWGMIYGTRWLPTHLSDTCTS